MRTALTLVIAVEVVGFQALLVVFDTREKETAGGNQAEQDQSVARNHSHQKCGHEQNCSLNVKDARQTACFDQKRHRCDHAHYWSQSQQRQS